MNNKFYLNQDEKSLRKEHKIIKQCVDDYFRNEVDINDIPDRYKDRVIYIVERIRLNNMIYNNSDGEDIKNKSRIELYQLKRHYSNIRQEMDKFLIDNYCKKI